MHEEILNTSIAVEKSLEALGLKGSGIGEKTRDGAGLLPPALVKKLHQLARARNEFVHEGRLPVTIERFRELAHYCVTELKLLTSHQGPSGSACATANPGSDRGEHHMRFSCEEREAREGRRVRRAADEGRSSKDAAKAETRESLDLGKQQNKKSSWDSLADFAKDTAEQALHTFVQTLFKK